MRLESPKLTSKIVDDSPKDQNVGDDYEDDGEWVSMGGKLPPSLSTLGYSRTVS